MQSVLLIDLSGSTATAQIIELDANKIEIASVKSCEVGCIFLPDELLSKAAQAESITSGTPTAAVIEDQNIGGPPLPDETSAKARPPSSAREVLKFILQDLAGTWSDAVVILPSDEGLSLHIELPFDDQKKISKILALEVQDRVPFDVSEFVIDAKNVGKIEGGGFDIHVSLAQRSYIKAILDLLREVNVEPLILTTAVGAICGFVSHCTGEITSDAAILLAEGRHALLCTRFDGQIRAERVLYDAEYAVANGEHAVPAYSALLMALQSNEKRYGTSVERLYVVGNRWPLPELQGAFMRPIEQVTVSRFVTSRAAEPTLSAFAALLALEDDAPTSLVNFRTGEFTYNRRMITIARATKRIAPYFFGTLLVGLLTLASTYMARGYQIGHINAEISALVRAAVPSLPVTTTAGSEIAALANEISLLERQLEGLGSLSRLSPLDAFLEVSNDFPHEDGVTVKGLSIKDNKIKLDVIAKDYSAKEKLGRTLRAKRATYCQVKENATSLGGSNNGKVSFSLEMTLCN